MINISGEKCAKKDTMFKMQALKATDKQSTSDNLQTEAIPSTSSLPEDLQKQKKRAERNGDLRGQADACRSIGEIYSRNEQFDEAIEEYREELLLCEALESQLSIALASRNLGEAYAKQQNFEKAVPLHKRYLCIARQCDNKLEEQRALATLGSTYFGKLETEDTFKGRAETYKLARDCFMKGLGVTEELKSTLKEVDYMDMKGRLYQNLGLLYDEMNQPETSSKYFHNALAINSKYSLLENLFMCQSSLTSVYHRHGNLVEAKKYAEMCLETARKMKAKEHEALALISAAMVLLNKEEFQQSRHLLKKAFKIGTPAQKDTCDRSYRSAKIIHKATEMLMKDTEQKLCTKMECFDKMGDAAADLGLYKLAIQYYKELLEVAREKDSSKQDLAKIHISLAMTYKDDKQLSKAIDHYKEEILCYSEEENDQICKSWMNIGAIQELLLDSIIEAKDSYVKAFNAAKRAKNGKLQVVALENLIALFKTHNNPELLAKSEEKLAHVQTKYQLNEGMIEDDTQLEEFDDKNVDDDISEMSDLTESEDEEIPDNSVSMTISRVCRKSRKIKRNLKGETPLHVACIAGNVQEVRKLISQGHRVNVQDYGGWTPLHEACNFGYVEIVKALVESGADFDNRGGDTCDGITPLMDAAGNGMIECVEFMLSKGANVLAKDDKNRTVVDHLMDYLERSEDELDVSMKVRCNNLVDRLRDKNPFHKAPVKTNKLQSRALISESDSQHSCRPGVRRKRSRNDIIYEDSSGSEEDVNNTRTSRRQSPSPLGDTDSQQSDDIMLARPLQDLTVQNNATETYRNAMACVGRSAQRSSHILKKSPKKSMEKTALIMEDEYVQDDWLIDDVSPLAKRRKVGVDAYLLTSHLKPEKENMPSQKNIRKPRKRIHQIVIDDSDSDSGPEITPHIDNTAGQSGVGHSEDIYIVDSQDETDPIIEENRIDNISSNNTLQSLNSYRRQTKLTDFRSSVRKSNSLQKNDEISDETWTDDSHTSVVGQSTRSLIKIKVQIQDKLLLVPVVNFQGTKTISGLAEDVCDRYYKLYSVRPVLTLGTQDGARFSPDDLVSLILSDGDKIEGFLERWHIPPMTETYRAACRTLNAVFYKNIEKKLITCENTAGKLDLNNLCLRGPRVRPIVEAITHQHCLRQLELKGNRLADEGVEALSKVLKTLPNLTDMGLACNNITGIGLLTIADAVAKDKEITLKNLDRLDISYNALTDSSQPHLLSLLRSVPSLNKLSLASCSLTSEFFNNDRLVIAQVFKRSSLQHIDISYNNLEGRGIYFLLRFLNRTKILSMNLTSTLSKFSRGIWEYLRYYVAKDGCVLQHLEMCHVRMKADVCDDIKRFIESATNLQSLDLSYSRSLNNDIMEGILKGMCKETSMLEQLILNDCGTASPLSLELIDSLGDQLAVPCPLRELQFTCADLNKADSDSLAYVWKEKWAESADIQIEGNSLKFGVKVTG